MSDLFFTTKHARPGQEAVELVPQNIYWIETEDGTRYPMQYMQTISRRKEEDNKDIYIVVAVGWLVALAWYLARPRKGRK